MGRAQVISLGWIYAFYFIPRVYRWIPAWSRMDLCYTLDGWGKPFTFVAFWCAKEKQECSRNSLWLNVCEADKLDNCHCVSSGAMGLWFSNARTAPSVDILLFGSRIIKVWGNMNLYLPLIKQGPTSDLTWRNPVSKSNCGERLHLMKTLRSKTVGSRGDLVW